MCNSSNNETDQCGCQTCCSYPNGGVIALIVAQIMFFIATMLSLFSMGDCEFVRVDADKVDPYLSTIIPYNITTTNNYDNSTKRGLGFFFWEDMNGECNWDREHTEQSVEEYFDFLGSDWEDPRGMGVTANVFGWIFFIWLIIFSCIAHKRYVRYVFVALVIIIMVIFQSATYAVLDSDFCQENDCKIGRSARYGAIAIPMFVISAILVLSTKNYPGGSAVVQQQPMDTDNIKEVHPSSSSSGQVDDDETTKVNNNNNKNQDGFNDAVEIPVEPELVDISLVDPEAAPTKATIY